MKALTLAAAALLTSATGSFAATGPLDLSTGSTGFSNTPLAGSFLDVYTFNAVSSFVLNASVTTVLNGAQDVDFTSIFITGPSGTFNLMPLLADPVEVWATPAAGFQFGPGAYSLSLMGVNSAAAGSYGGNIAVSAVAAVPEPETYALMLAGLGAVGFIARKRRRA
jgi:hypothetical protein